MNKVRRLFSKVRGQATTEFMLALPIMMIMLVGVIELARLVQAWLAVENAARFGARYAVTGDYDTAYCEDANLALGWPTAVYDGYNGDPIDCIVPRGADPINYLERTTMLVDWARLPSIRDAAMAGSAGAMIDDDATYSDPGYMDIVTCSYPSNLTETDYNQDPIAPPQCNPVDDPGDPGNPVRITVFHNHSLIIPFLGPGWPHITIVGTREMIVETFRSPRVMGAPMPLLTATLVATNTSTPYLTETPWGGFPTSTTTPIFDTQTPTITQTPSPTPTINPACIGLDFATNWQLISNGDEKLLSIDVINQTDTKVTLDHALLLWENYSMYATYQNVKEIKFEDDKIFRGPDYTSPTSTGWGVYRDLAVDETKTYQVKFGVKDGPWSETDYGPGDFGVILDFTNGCTIEKEVTVRNRPTVTPTPQGAECTGLEYINDWQLISNDNEKLLSIDVMNTTGSDVKLNDAIFYWGNFDAVSPWQAVKEIKFDKDVILKVKDYDSPTYTGGNENRTLKNDETKTFLVKFEVKDGPWENTDFEPGDFGVRLEFDNGCSLFKPVTVTDRPTVTPTPPIQPGPEGVIWYYGYMNTYVWAKVEWHTNPDGSVTTRVTFSKTFVDNTYGSNAIGWPSGHTFGDLSGSDHVRIAFKGMDRATYFDAKFDYITGAGTCYSSLGVSGGDGKLYLGDVNDVLETRSSLVENLCVLGCKETSDSPPTDENYTPSAECPGWDYTVWYEITLDASAFEPVGFGYPLLTEIHASPSKTGMNSEPVGPGAPTPVNSPTPTPTEYICSDC
jgi:Flp pilus assembly protein TadG